MRIRVARLGVWCAVLLASTAPAACGGDDEAEQGADAAAPRTDELASARRNPLISREDISRAGRDSPAAALLSWWQALQFSDPQAARTMYARDARPSGLDRQVRILGPYLATSRPEVLESQVAGDRARLLVVLHGTRRSGREVYPTETPATFRLVREPDGWKLEDNRYLTARLRAYEEAVGSSGR